ncbi:MAG: transposase [Desulfobacteraceae bacterium]|nr:transposase [Desulfobacteraceae bacterium]
MKIRKAYKYRLKTKPEQETLFRQQAGCCRFVWNKALALQKERLDSGEKVLRYVEMAKLLTGWKKEEEITWLAEAQSQTMQQTLKFLDQAIKEAFDKKNPKRFPRFKKKGKSIDSFRYPQGFKLDGNRVFLPKIGWVRFTKSREIEGVPRNITVSRRGDHWYVSIQTEREIAEPIHPCTSSVGIDMGLTRLATLSDGSFLEPLNSFKKLEKKLAKEQRRLARKKKLSTNWEKQKRKLTRLHIRIADARNDYLHKSTATISKNHAIVCVEDLKIQNMSRSAGGTIEAPGKNVRAKSGLNKSILDQGWFEFRRQLDYKLAWNGGWLISVPPRNTSRTCPACGHTAKENRKTQAQFRCLDCGFEEHADLVGAINILRAGHARFACEVSGAVMPPAAGTSQSSYTETYVLA